MINTHAHHERRCLWPLSPVHPRRDEKTQESFLGQEKQRWRRFQGRRGITTTRKPKLASQGAQSMGHWRKQQETNQSGPRKNQLNFCLGAHYSHFLLLSAFFVFGAQLEFSLRMFWVTLGNPGLPWKLGGCKMLWLGPVVVSLGSDMVMVIRMREDGGEIYTPEI